MTIRRVAAALAIGAAMALCGCDRGEPNDPGPPPSSNWDSMVWDQGTWG